MRFFIALEIPETSRQELALVQQKLQKVIPNVRLTNNHKLHLTIAFVGERPEKIKGGLIKVITEAASDIPPFQVAPAYIDAFPNLHHPKIFWVGVKGDIDKLFIIRERIKDGLTRLKLPIDERRYIPHIAIAKLNNNFRLRADQEAELQKITAIPLGPIQISSIKLFESIPEHGFHKHNTLAESLLNT